MAFTDTPLTDEPRCPDCAHPGGCPCLCCPAAIEELEFAGMADAAAARAIRDGDYEMADYLLDVADYWGGEPDEGTRVMRFALLSAALARNGG